MTTKLDTIKATVAAHFAAKEAFVKAGRAIEKYGYGSAGVTDAQRKAYHQYSSAPDVAMTMLRDLLPLLDAAVKIELNDGKLPEFTWYSLVHDYETEVAKLLEEQ